MNIVFGTVIDLKKLNKPFTTVTTKNAEFVATNEAGDPVYKLQYDATLDNVNYAQIGSNYYFMERPTHTNGFTYVTLHRDPLKTFAPYILNSVATVTRCNKGDRYIVDNRATKTERIAMQYRTLGTPFHSGASYIIVKGM